ncbi:MAG: hypothetical protein JNM18_19420 [Planctomycetaceae bacterium]|nr:hypothetical protein [Planctomycetaceae bacterium]
MTILFENPWPIYAGCAVLGLGVIIVWSQTRDPRWLIGVVLSVLLGFVAWGCDQWVVTDREFLEAWFPRLAQAAEQGDVDTLLAAIDPTLRPKQNEARQVMQQFKPTEVKITDLQLAIHEQHRPLTATADLICRVAGRLPGAGGGETHLVGVRVEMRKVDDQWLIVDFSAERPDPFKKLPR